MDDAAVVEDYAKVSFTSHLYNMHESTAVFDNTEKLLARLCLMNEKLTTEQAAGILFAVRHTPEARAAVLELCRKVLDPYVFSRVEEFAAEGRLDAPSVFLARSRASFAEFKLTAKWPC